MGEPVEKVDDVLDDIDDDDITDIEDEDLIDDPGGDPPDPAVTDGGPVPPDDYAEPEPKKKKGGVQKRIDKLTKDKKKAELDAAFWRGKAEGKAEANRGAEPEPEPEPEPTPRLSRDDYDTEEEYLDAAVDLRLERKETATTAKERVDAINEQYTAAREKYEDFDEVALVNDGTVPITRAMFEAAMGDNLTEILYHLGKNPDLTVSISKMTPMQAAREIGKIEMAIMPTKKKDDPKLKLKQTTKAPDPAPTVKGGGADPSVNEGAKTQKQQFAAWDKEREDRIKSGHGG